MWVWQCMCTSPRSIIASPSNPSPSRVLDSFVGRSLVTWKRGGVGVSRRMLKFKDRGSSRARNASRGIIQLVQRNAPVCKGTRCRSLSGARWHARAGRRRVIASGAAETHEGAHLRAGATRVGPSGVPRPQARGTVQQPGAWCIGPWEQMSKRCEIGCEFCAYRS